MRIAVDMHVVGSSGMQAIACSGCRMQWLCHAVAVACCGNGICSGICMQWHAVTMAVEAVVPVVVAVKWRSSGSGGGGGGGDGWWRWLVALFG